jgi:FkbM family methyltransferase
MARGVTRAILDALERHGYTMLANWRLERYNMARCLRDLFRLLEVDCVLDVGANVGQYRNFLRYEVGYEGRIVSFEPIPGNVEILTRQAATDAAWQVESFALGAAPGRSTFNVTAATVFSSFLQPNRDAAVLFHGENEVKDRIEVEVRKLDDVFPELERRFAPKRVYLKLDTQGYDLEVVRGGRAAMSRICGLQTEASVRPIYDRMPDYATTIRELEARGFELCGLYPVASGTFPRLVEFDCVMVASRFADAGPKPA